MSPGDIIASHMFHKWSGYHLINPDNVKRKCINVKLFPTIFLQVSLEELVIAPINLVHAEKKINVKKIKTTAKPLLV